MSDFVADEKTVRQLANDLETKIISVKGAVRYLEQRNELLSRAIRDDMFIEVNARVQVLKELLERSDKQLSIIQYKLIEYADLLHKSSETNS